MSPEAVQAGPQGSDATTSLPQKASALPNTGPVDCNENMNPESSQSSQPAEAAVTTEADPSPDEEANQDMSDLQRTTRLPKDLDVKEIDARALLDCIPSDGIHLQTLAERFGVDKTNYHLFFKLSKAGCEMKVFTVTPSSRRLDDEAIEAIYKAARRPAIPLQLKPRQRVIAKLIGSIKITRDGPEERLRAQQYMLPSHVYRTFKENSATYSCFTTEHTYIQRREILQQSMRKGIAFQAMKPLDPKRDWTQTRIERHFREHEKKDPSSYISCYDNLMDAKDKAVRHTRSGTSQCLAERIAIAEIKTDDFTAVTVHATIDEYIETKIPYNIYPRRSHERQRQVAIPAYIHKSAFKGPEDNTPIIAKESEDLNVSGWFLASELCRSDMNVVVGPSHQTECLAFGDISISDVTNVWPFDGTTLFKEPIGKDIRSLADRRWKWSWTSRMWLEDRNYTIQKLTEAKRIKQESIDTEEDRVSTAANQHQTNHELAPPEIAKLSALSDDEDEAMKDDQPETGNRISKRAMQDMNLDSCPKTKRRQISRAQLPASEDEPSNLCSECRSEISYAEAWIQQELAMRTTPANYKEDE